MTAPAADLHEAIRTHLATAVPFAAHTGVELAHVGDGEAVATLPDAPAARNHIGSLHAGALFTLAEAASGAAMAGALADRIFEVRPLVRSADIAYRKVARGTITATARTSVEPDALRAQLAASGRVELDVEVAMTDERGVEVATMRVAWVVTTAPAA